MRLAIFIAMFLGGCAAHDIKNQLEAEKRHSADLKHDLDLCMKERRALINVLGEARKKSADPKLRDK